MDHTDANLLGKNEPEIAPNVFQSLSRTRRKIPVPEPGPSGSVSHRRVSIAASSDTYDTDNSHLGVALIFNHNFFADQSQLPEDEGNWIRLGSEYDRERLYRVLKDYRFDVRAYQDLTFSQIIKVLEAVSKEDHSDNDCLFVAVMTHGTSGRLSALNKDYPVETLWEMFLGSACKSLIGKPKLFFIQACRGEKFDSGVQFRGYTTMSRDATDSRGQQVTYTIPSTADLLVMYSTFDERFSWHNPTHGSWFIQSLCAELEKGLKSTEPTELFRLLTAVSRRIAYEYLSYPYVLNRRNMDEMKEMPNFVSTLTKVFYIMPKNE